MIKVTKIPDFKKTFKFLERIDKYDPKPILEKYGALGVSALAKATPVDSGETAAGWSYEVKGNKNYYQLIWKNNQMAGTAPLVLIIQYGHATRGGTFVPGRDIINPALRPIYDALHDELVEEALL
jgi:hypothetical protein